MISETILPWVLGTFLALTLAMIIASIKSWRDMKQSPYFFLRRQAEKRLQSYAFTSFVLMVVVTAVVAYGWQAPVDPVVRTAVLPRAKPPQEEVVALLERRQAREVVTDTVAAETATVRVSEANLALGADAPLADAAPELPVRYDQYDPKAELKPDTALGEIVFSTEVDDNYQAIEPTRIFAEGNYTLYATFPYEFMENGMAWSWVWRHNGQVVDGGNEYWEYGEEGPGYIYYGPEEGFQPGEYTLEVWVNGKLMTSSSLIMNSAAISAGN